jgi:hypothetical protein
VREQLTARTAIRQTHCLYGHDLRLPGARGDRDECASCLAARAAGVKLTRVMRPCPRGHSRDERVRVGRVLKCRACYREMDRNRKRAQAAGVLRAGRGWNKDPNAHWTREPDLTAAEMLRLEVLDRVVEGTDPRWVRDEARAERQRFRDELRARRLAANGVRT